MDKQSARPRAYDPPHLEDDVELVRDEGVDGRAVEDSTEDHLGRMYAV